MERKEPCDHRDQRDSATLAAMAPLLLISIAVVISIALDVD
jgi:hypothetical protein